jgi:hypothetical protein
LSSWLLSWTLLYTHSSNCSCCSITQALVKFHVFRRPSNILTLASCSLPVGTTRIDFKVSVVFTEDIIFCSGFAFSNLELTNCVSPGCAQAEIVISFLMKFGSHYDSITFAVFLYLIDGVYT